MLVILCLHISDSATYAFSPCFGYGIQHGLPALLSRVECSSAELQLSQCNYTRFSGIYWHDQYGVRCQTTRESEYSDV